MSGTLATQFDSRTGFANAVLAVMSAAMARRARRICCVDPDFADWPLDDAELHAKLAEWLRLPDRKLVLLAARYEEVPRRCPRFTRWRANWVHAIDAFAVPEDLQGGVPCILVDDDALGLELLDRVHWRGRASDDARAAHLLREQVDAFLQRSEPAFPLNQLGL